MGIPTRIAKKAPEGLPDPKKYLLRFGLLNPAMLSLPKRELLAKTINRNLYNQPVYYLDEWFAAVGTNEVKPSNVDEAKVSRYDKRAQYRGLLERAQGKFDGAKNLLAERGKYKSDLEAHLIKQFSFTSKRFPMQNYPDLNCSYNGAQKKVFVEIQEIMKQLAKVNREEETYLRDLVQAENDIAAINAKIKEEGNSVKVDTGAIAEEFNAIRQMAKMTIGSRGNHFPILTNDFFHCLPTDLGCRENIISVLAWIESIDPEAFCRVYKNQMNRIVPFVILLPGYGDRGICWEPLDHTNRAASRGRIAVPMYAKDLRNAVLYAVADLRWQVAKEKASFYWMEEGITGNYYQWFLKMKLKGDVKDSFISDYMVWIIKESDGIQKLPKELRGTFWRYLPFSQPVKDKLRTRSLTYQELYQRDLNRAMSDGY